MVTVVVCVIWSVVLPLVPNVAVPVPLLAIARLTVAVVDELVIWTLAVPPLRIGLGAKESIVTVGASVVSTRAGQAKFGERGVARKQEEGCCDE